MRYSAVKFFSANSIRVLRGQDRERTTTAAVESVDNEDLNELLAKGWELVQIVTHYSREHDFTAVVAVLGKPVGKDSSP